MRFLKYLWVLLICFLLFALNTSKTFAQDEFSTDVTVTYHVLDTGKTQINQDVTLENNFSTLYATTYTLTLDNIDVENIQAFNITDSGQTPLSVDTQKSGDTTTIKITFTDSVVGKGAKRHFVITYDNSSFAARTGEVWEVSIPRLSADNNFRSYKLILQIPNSFGLEAYVSPKPESFSATDAYKEYTFSKAELTQTGITAGFGQFQVFSFNLAYHLENPLAVPSSANIALPPDTAFQKIYFSKIDPKPTSVNIDEDGNWLATYKLAPRQRVDVIVSGSVQIFASYRPFPKPGPQVLSDNLNETQFWQVNDPSIKALATQLKTPKAIYDYVSTTLKYDFSRVQPNVQRLGAVGALRNPTQAICMEYTDLFIALARAAGIPAREINGYAYTENPQLQPLSLVADVLHSWPEYYDNTKGAWIPVDPTWGSTTGGEDFFNKLDLRHFTFVIHGKDSVKPYPPGSYKLGPNPQKDVFVSFGKLPAERISTPVLSVINRNSPPFLPTILNLKIENPGPAAIYSLTPTVYFDNVQKEKASVMILPPYANYQMQITVPFSLLGKDTPQEVSVVVENARIDIPLNKTQVILNSLLALFFFFILIMIYVLVRLKKISFKPLSAKISWLYGKIFRKAHQNQNSS